jgi:hypothetical protein
LIDYNFVNLDYIIGMKGVKSGVLREELAISFAAAKGGWSHIPTPGRLFSLIVSCLGDILLNHVFLERHI